MTTDLTIRTASDIDAVNEAIAALDPTERDATVQPWDDFDGEEIADNVDGSGSFLVLLTSGEVVKWHNADRQWVALDDSELDELGDEALYAGDDVLYNLCQLVVCREFVVLGEGREGIYPVDTAEQAAEVEALLAAQGAESAPVWHGAPLAGHAVQGTRRILAQ